MVGDFKLAKCSLFFVEQSGFNPEEGRNRFFKPLIKIRKTSSTRYCNPQGTEFHFSLTSNFSNIYLPQKLSFVKCDSVQYFVTSYPKDAFSI